MHMTALFMLGASTLIARRCIGITIRAVKKMIIAMIIILMNIGDFGPTLFAG